MVTETEAMELEYELNRETCDCGDCECERPILFTEEEVCEIVDDAIDYIKLGNKDGLFEMKEFADGLSDGMRFAGMFTVLRNAGVSEEKAIELITLSEQIKLEECSRKHEYEVVKMNGENQLKIEQTKAQFDEIEDILGQ